jgi:hypothetical protein
MPAITFLSLLNEGFKLEVIDLKKQMTIAKYGSLDSEDQNEIIKSIVLPEDVLSDILESENVDNAKELETFKQILNAD